MANTRTMAQSGVLSATTTWTGGVVPVDGDTAVVPLGMTLTHDTNQSAFVTGITLTLNGNLTVTSTPGHYTLALAAIAIGAAGTILVGTSGTPLPQNVIFDVLELGTCTFTGNLLNRLALYGYQPTNSYAIITGNCPIGTTSIPVDRDVTEWAGLSSISVRLDNVDPVSNNQSDAYTASAITSSTITVPALTRAKVAGSLVVLVNRNINFLRPTGATSIWTTVSNAIVKGVAWIGNSACYGWYNSCNSNILTSCTFSGNNYGCGNSCNSNILTSCTFSGNSSGLYSACTSNTLTRCTFSGNYYGWANGCNSNTLTSCTFSGNLSGWNNGCNTNTLTSCTFSGNTYGWYSICNSNTLTSCAFSGNTYGWSSSCNTNTLTSCTFSGNTYGWSSSCNRHVAVNCSFTLNTTGILTCSDSIFADCLFSLNTTDLNGCDALTFDGGNLGSTVSQSSCYSIVVNNPLGANDAFIVWPLAPCRLVRPGSISHPTYGVTSQMVMLGVSNLVPICDYHIQVQAGLAYTFIVYSKIDSINWTQLPVLSLFVAGSDPLAGNTPIWTATMANNTSWQTWTVTYTPTYNQTVILRTMAQNATGNCYTGNTMSIAGVTQPQPIRGSTTTIPCQFVDSSGNPLTGVSATIDLYDTNGLHAITAQALIYMAGGYYAAILSATTIGVGMVYTGAITTTDSRVAVQTIPVTLVIGQNGNVDMLKVGDNGLTSTRVKKIDHLQADITVTPVGGTAQSGDAYAWLNTAFTSAATALANIAAAVWASGTRTLTGFGTLIADVWSYISRTITSGGITKADVGDELATYGTAKTIDIDTLLTTTHFDSTIGAPAHSTVSGDIAANATAISGVAAAVWAALTSTMTTAGSIGKKLADWVVGQITGYASGQDPVTLINAGTGRVALVDHLNADITSRMATFTYTAPDNADIAAIKTKTDNLPTNPAATTDIPSASISAIKAKTDNLPASPAATGAAMTLTTAYDAAKTAAQASDIPVSNITAIRAKTDNLPASPMAAGNVTVGGYATNQDPVTLINAGTGRVAKIDNADVATSTRLAGTAYTAPDNAGIADIVAVLPATVIAAKSDLPDAPDNEGIADIVALLPLTTIAASGDEMALTGAAITAIGVAIPPPDISTLATTVQLDAVQVALAEDIANIPSPNISTLALQSDMLLTKAGVVSLNSKITTNMPALYVISTVGENLELNIIKGNSLDPLGVEGRTAEIPLSIEGLPSDYESATFTLNLPGLSNIALDQPEIVGDKMVFSLALTVDQTDRLYLGQGQYSIVGTWDDENVTDFIHEATIIVS